MGMPSFLDAPFHLSNGPQRSVIALAHKQAEEGSEAPGSKLQARVLHMWAGVGGGTRWSSVTTVDYVACVTGL